ncbi:MAG: hypothetical protein JW902_09760 [Syntrophaceae bacterium]|nr:hypothetical protein [Syntrophaceae bacterium]
MKTEVTIHRYRGVILFLCGMLLGFGIVLIFLFLPDLRLGRRSVLGLSLQDRIPAGVVPGPPREVEKIFRLELGQAIRLAGMDDPENERWLDIAGNSYTGSFVREFSYQGEKAQVLVAIEEKSDTFRGRLEARGLKPNFAYQIKLRGIFGHLDAFERIGYAGRWRFPGKATNYTDAEYMAKKDKSDVEAYIFFDFFVTDKNGDAVRDFALDSSLHVLWNTTRQGGTHKNDDLVAFSVEADDPEVYSRPKKRQDVELLMAERECGRYVKADQRLFLPNGRYIAEIVLTEESFHSIDNDGGHWATVFKSEIEFTVEPR